MARVRSHVTSYNATALFAREQQAEPQKHTARIHRPTYTPFRFIGIFPFQLEHFFLTRDFPIFSSSSSSFFFFIFFLSHRPSALKKRGKGLIFTPNISTGDVGVHRHQAIVPFLLYDTTTNHWAFNFTLLNDAILQLPRLSAYALQYIALIPRVVAGRCFRLCNFWLPQLQLQFCLW